MMQGKKQSCAKKAEEKWAKLVAARLSYLASHPGNVASRPLPNFLEHLLL
jgi:hypothetical protein